MRHSRIVKDAQHVGQGIHFPQRRKHCGIFRPVFHHAADVNIFDRGIRNFLRVIQRSQLFEPRLRHSRNANVRGRARRLLVQLRARQNFEKRSFADLRKPNDPSLHRVRIVAYPRARRL